MGSGSETWVEGRRPVAIRELAERLEVTPTAVRDALLRAQTTGLLRVLPRAGAFLRATSPVLKSSLGPVEELTSVFQSAPIEEEHNLLHLLDARRLIEIELVGRAAERRRLEDLLPVRRILEAMLQLPEDTSRSEQVTHDIRFHVEIARLAGNSVLFTVQRMLMELLRPHLNAVPKVIQRRSRKDESHVAIYEALVAGNAEKARNVMREHLSLAYDGLLRSIQEPPAVGERTGRVGQTIA